MLGSVQNILPGDQIFLGGTTIFRPCSKGGFFRPWSGGHEKLAPPQRGAGFLALHKRKKNLQKE